MNKYCGPAVLSILTGKSTDECASAINTATGRYGEVRAVFTSDLIKAADLLGFDSRAIEPARSLYGTLIKLAVEDGIYVISLETHFVTVEVKDKTIFLCDNHTKEPMPASSARLLQGVRAVHKVFKRPEPRKPVIISTKIVGEKTLTIDEGYCTVKIYEFIMYDMEEYNRRNTIGWVRFKTEQDFNEFIDSIK
jgi:hypothetical protein